MQQSLLHSCAIKRSADVVGIQAQRTKNKASLLADVDDDEDDATVAMSLGDEEEEELLTGGNISSKERATISYTTAQFHETKLLKLLNDATAPHYLY